MPNPAPLDPVLLLGDGGTALSEEEDEEDEEEEEDDDEDEEERLRGMGGVGEVGGGRACRLTFLRGLSLPRRPTGPT